MKIIPHRTNEFELLKDNLVKFSYTFLHGKLEDDAGYDIFSLLESTFPVENESKYFVNYKQVEKGIYPCIYNDKKCSLYFWKCSFNRPHGLVIYNNDKKSLKYVKKCYSNNVEFV